jgi:hypothetical protein
MRIASDKLTLFPKKIQPSLHEMLTDNPRESDKHPHPQTKPRVQRAIVLGKHLDDK